MIQVHKESTRFTYVLLQSYFVAEPVLSNPDRNVRLDYIDICFFLATGTLDENSGHSGSSSADEPVK
jgi:hypothetical protein